MKRVDFRLMGFKPVFEDLIIAIQVNYRHFDVNEARKNEKCIKDENWKDIDQNRSEEKG